MPDDQAALLAAHIPGLRRFARALSRGDRERADDLVQDSLERALAHWQGRRAEGSLRGWLCTIVYNRFVSEERLRRRRGVHLHLEEAGEAELPEVDGGQDAALQYRDFLRAFRTLPEDQRSVLLLVGMDNLSYREAAQTLGVPIGTVMSRLSRARDRLRQGHLGVIAGSAAAGRGARSGAGLAQE
ncbi:MAG: sigma-70 family RNA polymerase sigma factor [Stellaceae bacterium]